MSHRVTAAYVTLRVPNELGQEVLVGFYAGAVLPKRANSVDLDRHIRKGMIEKVSAAQVEAAPEPEPVEPEQPERPAQNASKADWVAYAESQGVTRDEAEAATKADLIEMYGG